MQPDDPKQPGLRINQVYLSTAHFEHGADALSVPRGTNVTVHFGINAEVRGANEGKAGIIKLAIATSDEPGSLYRFHIEMTGIIEGETDDPHMSVEDYATKVGVTMMFPFLREAVANLTGRGRFGAIYLKPFNVHALKLEKVAAEGTTAEQ